MERTITIAELAAALNCTQDNVLRREGSSIPAPLQIRPRIYRALDVLWVVGGYERESVCLALGLSVEQLRACMAAALLENSYVPNESEGDNLLM
jgi:hypothetical protein